MIGHGHQHGHVHGGPSARAGLRHRHRLVWALVLVGGFLGVELAAAVVSNSLALGSDVGHMFGDVTGLALALAAVQLAERHAARGDAGRHTFGLYRLEIIGAFVNSLLLVGVAVWLVVEAVSRLGEPPQVMGGWMVVAAAGGLVVNVAAFLVLRPGAAESLNVKAASVEVLADLVGSVAALAAGVAVWSTGAHWVDAAVGGLVGLWILPRAVGLGRQATRILLQSAPGHLDVAELQRSLEGLEGVREVHDLHVWTLTSEMESLSAHLVLDEGAELHDVLDRARDLLRGEWGIAHATLQVEPADHEGCDQVGW